LIDLKKLISVQKSFENFISIEKHIVVFKQYILDNCDRLVKFEDIDVLKWTSDKVFMDQFPSVEGVRVKSLQS
jgi:hypothetical protein